MENHRIILEYSQRTATFRQHFHSVHIVLRLQNCSDRATQYINHTYQPAEQCPMLIVENISWFLPNTLHTEIKGNFCLFFDFLVFKQRKIVANDQKLIERAQNFGCRDCDRKQRPYDVVNPMLVIYCSNVAANAQCVRTNKCFCNTCIYKWPVLIGPNNISFECLTHVVLSEVWSPYCGIFLFVLYTTVAAVCVFVY